VAPKDIAAHYAAHDLYVQSPNVDNMPTSILEAFASGLPVVATTRGGVPAILTDGTHGLLAPRDNHRALADRIVRLLEQPAMARRLARNAYATCQAYTWPRVRDQVAVELPRRDWRAGRDTVRRRARPSVSMLTRLSRMSLGELGWRSRASARIAWDRILAAQSAPAWNRSALPDALAAHPSLDEARASMGQGEWLLAHRRLARHFTSSPRRFPLSPADRRLLVPAIKDRFPDATSDARARADNVVAGQYDLLGYLGLTFGSAQTMAIDWQRDPVHDRRAPRRFWSRVPYLDPACGDHKIIWELNRHQHWLALGRAHWLTGDSRYRDRFVFELTSWLDANPPLTGINWASNARAQLPVSLVAVDARVLRRRQLRRRAAMDRRSPPGDRSPAHAGREEPLLLLQPQHASAW